MVQTNELQSPFIALESYSILAMKACIESKIPGLEPSPTSTITNKDKET